MSRLWIALALPLLLVASPAAGVTKCKAVPARDGTIAVTAANVVGTPRWGTRYGEATHVFPDAVACVANGKARKCALAPIGDPARSTPPAGCTLYLEGLKRYGMILADNGSPWFISGAPDRRWDDDDLRMLKTLQGSDFEVVDVSSLMVDPDSGQAAP